MKKLVVLLAVLSLLALFGCELDGGGTATRVIEGSISFTSAPNWDTVKLGVFSGGSAGTYPSLGSDDNSLGVNSYRLTYTDANDDSVLDVSPVAGSTANISSTGDTSRTYSFELPATLPVEDEYYHFVSWKETGGAGEDGMLRLADTSDPGIVMDDAEMNRLPTRDTTNLSDEPTTITIFYFIQSQDLDSNPTGNYKYVGYDDAAYNEQLELDTENNSGFDFAMATVGGW